MYKTKLFLDYDGVIVDSISAICKVYNTLYQHHPNFIPANPNKVETWSMKEIIPLCNNVEELFECSLFFKYVEFMPDAKEVLEELSKKYNIHIVSIGTMMNISQKAAWIHENLPFIKNTILISKDGGKMGKDMINMDMGIIIDDHQDNLKNPTISLPIVFGKKFVWNKDFRGIRCDSWKKVRRFLLEHIE
jgi:5'(3')-deoxyribonucleotidase